ncbi:hypothetical protein AV654_16585 [Paenibacillus elgii]|uniref:NAD-dependent epimerase/dehydratase domain-containing protein n=1 Tax=Paenibacillus elgii TaxID=189691 RepID=A0A161S3N2_9BACL|nr:NAD-dependent epimerase/dehydratase family protein [Paenibacillus elgii]KZE79099.1 hypothetical protein AV654_16585 [Paenibacillus elgii]
MKLLILGGTVFLGYHLAQSAMRSGHEVTLFTRGITNPEVLPEAEKLRGDRDGNLSALKGRRWDAVVDTSAYVPRIVKQSAERLAYCVEHYTFVSSISVYRDFSKPGVHEGDPVGELDDPASENVRKHYGELKALCERQLEELMPGRALNVRSGLIVGPQDPTDRFAYWPIRIRKGGRVLAPGHPEARLQFIDVRDLSDWIIRMAEAKTAGTFNAVGPAEPLAMRRLLEACARVTGSDPELVWVGDEFLHSRGASPWDEIPLWFPVHAGLESFAHYMNISVEKALAAGLTFRTLEDTIAAALEWCDARPPTPGYSMGLDPDKEVRWLAEWDELG